MPTDRIIRFADFELDVERYQLRRAGEEVRLERLPMDLLILFASRHGELLSRASSPLARADHRDCRFPAPRHRGQGPPRGATSLRRVAGDLDWHGGSAVTGFFRGGGGL
jgi:hypothetical protein